MREFLENFSTRDLISNNETSSTAIGFTWVCKLEIHASRVCNSSSHTSQPRERMEMESRQTLEVHLCMNAAAVARWLENWLIDNPRQLSDFLVQNGHAAVYRGGSPSARQTTSIKWKTKQMHLSVKSSLSAAHQIMDQLIHFFPIPLSISSCECTVGAEVVCMCIAYCSRFPHWNMSYKLHWMTCNCCKRIFHQHAIVFAPSEAFPHHNKRQVKFHQPQRLSHPRDFYLNRRRVQYNAQHCRSEWKSRKIRHTLIAPRESGVIMKNSNCNRREEKKKRKTIFICHKSRHQAIERDTVFHHGVSRSKNSKSERMIWFDNDDVVFFYHQWKKFPS